MVHFLTFSEFPRLRRLRLRELDPLTMPPLSIMPSALHWCHAIHRWTERRTIRRTRTSHTHVSKTIPNFLLFHRYNQTLFSTLKENIVIGNLKGPHHAHLPVSDIQDAKKIFYIRHNWGFLHIFEDRQHYSRGILTFSQGKRYIFPLSATYHTFKYISCFKIRYTETEHLQKNLYQRTL